MKKIRQLKKYIIIILVLTIGSVLFVNFTFPPLVSPNKILLDENDTISKWDAMTSVNTIVADGLSSAQWMGANGIGNSAMLVVSPNQTNWSSYKGIRLWLYSAVANNAEILLTLTSPGTSGDGDYYYASIFMTWNGWNAVNIPFSSFKTSRAPAGFSRITKVAFNSKGWWLKPKSDTKLIFDRIILNNSVSFPDPIVLPPKMTVFAALAEFQGPGGQPVPNFKTQYGFETIKFAYPGNRYNIATKTYGGHATSLEVRHDEVMAIAKDIEASSSKSIVCLDLEHWKMVSTGPSDDAEVARNINALGKIIDWMHSAAPSLRIGYYSLLPNRDYWRAQKGEGHIEYTEWQAENAKLASIAKKVDVIFPSLYTFYNDQPGWVKYAKANIAEAKKYNRPVYPFLWPQYHDSTALKHTRIDGNFWELQLNTLKDLQVDGIVMWDFAHNYETGKRLYWNPREGWWVSTLKFFFP